MSAPSRAELTTELITVLAAETGLAVGDGKAPGTPAAAPAHPYLVVTFITPQIVEGAMLGADGGIAQFTFQVTSVGLTRAQTDLAADRARQTITGRVSGGWEHPITTTAANGDDVFVMDRVHVSSSGMMEDQGIFNLADRYQLLVSTG